MRQPQLVMLLIALATGTGSIAQENDAKKEVPYADMSIRGMPRPKGAIFTYERHSGYDIQSDGQRDFIQDGSGRLKRNRLFEVKLKAPLLNHPGLKIATGFDYRVEEFRFDNPQQLTYPFYRDLEDKPLKKIGGTLYVIKPFRGNTYLFVRGAVNLNGDYSALDIPSSEFLKYSLMPLLGWKLDDRTVYGVGLSYGHSFGEMSIYPVIAYTRSYNSRWSLDLMLPVSAKVRHSPNEQTQLYAGAEVNGGNYAIRLEDPVFSSRYPVVHLQHSELRLLVSAEREIYDFIWFGLEAGTRTNLRYHLSDADNIEPDILIKNKLGQALLLNASLFLVAPKKYVK